MARNGRKSKVKRGAISVANKLFPFVRAATPIVAFLEQISAKDRLTLGATFSGASTTVQVKILANIVLGRIAGVTLFHNQTTVDPVTGAITVVALPTAPQTINLAGVLNKWTNAGLIGIVYKIVGGEVNKMVGSNVVPATAKIGSLAKGAFTGGMLGGVFDAPETAGSSVPTQGFPSLQGTPQLTVQSTSTSFHNTGADSTQSSMT